MSNSGNANALIHQYNSGIRDFTAVDLSEAKFYGALHKRIALNGIVLQLANARNAIFSHVDLANANLSQANLQGCSLKGSIVSADFTGANLTDARIGPGDRDNAVFQSADLTNADFGGSMRSSRETFSAKKTSVSEKRKLYTNIDFRQSNLTNAKLTSDFMGADFREAQLSGAVFKIANRFWYRATLCGANFQGVDLREKDFSGLDLSGANLSNANLAEANLSGANLEEANLLGANLEGAILDRANLRNAQIDNLLESRSKDYYAWEIQNQRGRNRDFRAKSLERLNLAECDLSNSDLSEANLEGTKLSKADLQGVRLCNASLSYANLSEARLATGNLHGVCAIDTNFSDANLTEAVLSGANLTNASLVGASLVATNFENANCTNSNFTGCDLSNASFRGCILTKAIIYDVDFSQASSVPDTLSSYIENSRSLSIRSPYRFRETSDEQHRTCTDLYGVEASQYTDYAVWFDQIPLLPSYRVPQPLLNKLFELSKVTLSPYRRDYTARFFFNIFSKPSSLFENLEPDEEEKGKLIEVASQVFAPLEVFHHEPDFDYDRRRTIQRPIIKQSQEEFSQWLAEASRLEVSEELDVCNEAATELANLVGEEVAVCRLNEGDYNENEQYSAYAVISQNYLMFVLKYWEL